MKTVKTILCVILAAVIFAASLSSVLLLGAKKIVSDPERLAKKIADEEYLELVAADVRGEIDRNMLLLAVDGKLFDENVSDAELHDAALASLTATVKRVLEGDSSPLPEFESQKLYEAIKKDVEGYAAEHSLEVEEGAVDEIYSFLCESVSARVRVIDEKYVNKIPELSRISRLASLWYVGIIAAAVCAAGIAALRFRTPAKILNAVAVPLYFSSFFGFVVFKLLEIKDYVSKVSLDESTFKMLLIKIYRAAVGEFAFCFGVFFIAGAALLIADVAVTAISGNKNNKTEPALEYEKNKNQDSE